MTRDAPGEPKARGEPHPRNTLNELTGEEWLYFTKSVWTTAYPSELGPCAAQGARREQAAAAHGQAHRVLHEARRAGPRPVRGCRRDAPRRGDRAAASARARDRALAALGGRLRAGRRRGQRGERGGAGPELVDLGPNDPGGPRSFDPSGCELRRRRRLEGPADARRRVGRLRRDRSAVQRPAADDDVRRSARRVVRQPPDGLRDGHRRRGRPGERRRLPGVPRPDDRGPRPSWRASSSAAATRC